LLLFVGIMLKVRLPGVLPACAIQYDWCMLLAWCLGADDSAVPGCDDA